MATQTSRNIRVDYVPRIEGDVGLDIAVSGNAVTHLRLRLLQPPRSFRPFLVGRPFWEVPATVSRICNICPGSHWITALQAIEAAAGVTPSPQCVHLRRVLRLAEWIQSHALHVYLLAAPDFLGYESASALASTYPEAVQRALRLKKLGKELTRAVSARPVPGPNGLRCTRMPDAATIERLQARLERARADATDTVALVSGLSFPSLQRQAEHVALTHSEEYPVNAGRLASTAGLDAAPGDYRHYVRDFPAPYSPATHFRIAGRGSFMVGPLPRVNLNRSRLCPAAVQALQSCGVSFPSFNPFTSVVARAIELVQAIDDCARTLARLEPNGEYVPVEAVAGRGAAVTEAPRGTLYHEYHFDSQGVVQEASIVAPTSHNLLNIEEDVRALVPHILELPEQVVRLRIEMLLRSYDPCLSCSCDYLRAWLRTDTAPGDPQ